MHLMHGVYACVVLLCVHCYLTLLVASAVAASEI